MKGRMIRSVSGWTVLFLFAGSATAFAFGRNNELEVIEALFNGGQYEQIYLGYLQEIPPFRPRAKADEKKFLYFARTCTALGYFDEAEGYLYTVRTQKPSLRYPELYDFCWAELEDARGEKENAYERYLFYVTLYPENSKAAYAFTRLFELAKETGREALAGRYWETLKLHYPDSLDFQSLQVRYPEKARSVGVQTEQQR